MLTIIIYLYIGDMVTSLNNPPINTLLGQEASKLRSFHIDSLVRNRAGFT